MECREWKIVINGGTVKTWKLRKPKHQNIENAESIPPQNPTEAESMSPQNPTYQNIENAESIPPQNPTESESMSPQNPTEAESMPPQSPAEEDSTLPRSPEGDSTPPRSPEGDSTPPQSPAEGESTPPQTPKPSVYNDNLQLRIPLFQYKPETPRPTRPRTPPTVTTETLQIITEEILDHNFIEPNMLDELIPERIDQIINELRQDDELQNIFTEIEEQIEFEQLGMDIDIPDYDTTENELLLW